jgi:2'-5' RNA ligase
MPQLIRSFVAIQLPDTLRYQIRGYIHSLESFTKSVRWVNTGNLHLTLKFIGERTPETTEQMLEALNRPALSSQPFRLTTTRFGGFPNLHRPKVLWLGSASQPETALNRLQQNIEKALTEIGIEAEARPFRPHLTLGRAKFKEDLSKLREFVEAHPFPPVSFPIDNFVLMRSLLKSQGAEYRVLQKYSLQIPK